jgi:hypothetical protein
MDGFNQQQIEGCSSPAPACRAVSHLRPGIVATDRLRPSPLFHQDDQTLRLSPLFDQDDQDDQIINYLIILPPFGRFLLISGSRQSAALPMWRRFPPCLGLSVE